MKMGTSMHMAIFQMPVQNSLVRWDRKAAWRRNLPIANSGDSPSNLGPAGVSSPEIQLQNAGQKESTIKEAVAGNSDPSSSNSG